MHVVQRIPRTKDTKDVRNIREQSKGDQMTENQLSKINRQLRDIYAPSEFKTTRVYYIRQRKTKFKSSHAVLIETSIRLLGYCITKQTAKATKIA